MIMDLEKQNSMTKQEVPATKNRETKVEGTKNQKLMIEEYRK